MNSMNTDQHVFWLKLSDAEFWFVIYHYFFRCMILIFSRIWGLSFLRRHKELHGQTLPVNIGLPDVYKYTLTYLFKGKIGGYSFKLFLPYLGFMKQPLPVLLFKHAACRITGSTQEHAITHVLSVELQTRSPDVSWIFFIPIANPWIIIAVPEKIEAIISRNSISA